jgi:hypothetical protein
MAQAEHIQLRIDTSTIWTAANPTLESGEAGLESNTGRIKIGDSTSAWTSLGYFQEKGPVYLKSYTVAQAEAIATTATRGMVWVSDETGGAQPAYCDGTSFFRFSDGAIIS